MIERLKTKLLTKLFIDWVKHEFDVETLEASKVMIQQRQDTINTLVDQATLRTPIGFQYREF